MKTALQELIDKWESEMGSYIPNGPIYKAFIDEAKSFLEKEKLQISDAYDRGLSKSANQTGDFAPKKFEESKDGYSKLFRYTLKSKEGKVILQEIVSFGSKEEPFPDDWENSHARVAVYRYEETFIHENFDIIVDENLEMDI